MKIDVVCELKAELEQPSLAKLKHAYDDYVNAINRTLELTVGRTEDVTVGEYMDRLEEIRSKRWVEASNQLRQEGFFPTI